MTLETAGTAARPPLRLGDGSSGCRFVEAVVSAALGIDLAELRGPRRSRAPVAFARQTAMYLAHVNLGLNLSEVGRQFGRDRTTVAHACAKLEDRRDDDRFDLVLVCLEHALDTWRRGMLPMEEHR